MGYGHVYLLLAGDDDLSVLQDTAVDVPHGDVLRGAPGEPGGLEGRWRWLHWTDI